MKLWPKLAAMVGVLFLLLGLFAVAYAAPAAQDAAPVVDTAAPIIPGLTEWQNSPHADVESESFRHWDADDPQEVPTSCAKCHSSAGYQDFLGVDGSEAGVVDAAAPVTTVVDCVACHNSATADKSSVVFPSGMEIANLGAESICMECHQGRESKISVDRQITDTFKLDPVEDLDTVVAPLVDEAKKVTTTFGFRNIHYYAAAATQYGTLAKGGYEYEGMSYDGKFEHPAPFDTCTGCHDAHSLEMNLEACATCHEGVETAEDLAGIRMAGSLMDYDGDGDAEEGIGEEYAGLQEKLGEAITAYATEVAGADIVYDSSAHPYWFADADADGAKGEEETRYATWTPRLLKAAFNYQVASKDPGAFAHNAKYVIQLMYDSIVDLNSQLDEPVDIEAAARNDVGHFDGTSEAFRYWDGAGAVPMGCAKCHSAAGLPQFLANNGTVAVDGRGTVHTVGVSAAPVSNGLACATCHDDLAEYTLYPVTGVPFPSGKTVSFSTRNDSGAFTDPVSSNMCLECHQGRASAASVNARTRNMEDDTVPEAGLGFINVHYFAAGASLFGNEASGAYEYPDKEYVGRFMHVPGFDTCVGCHEPHALNVKMETCTTCHAGAEEASAIRIAKDDFDGDGDANEGAAAEIATLQELLFAAILEYAETVIEKPLVYDSHSHPYFFNDLNANGEVDEDEAVRANGYSTFTPRLLKAAYNYQYSQKDPGIYAHNLEYAVQFLYDSLEDLAAGGVEVDLENLVRPEVE
jgi:hypothetical protein